MPMDDLDEPRRRRRYRRDAHFPATLKFKTSRGQVVQIERKADELGISVSDTIRAALERGLPTLKGRS